ncbi:MAG: L,D-transpeptidase family protein [Luteolibacter sp.]|uniref:L,D-transpeptidase family protein n=1 Tax=Luteolibacter sp. TaxID=1962973 RepID=UPI003267E552
MFFKSLLLLFLAVLPAAAFELPSNSSQCVVGISDGWDSSNVTLTFYEKSGGAWKPVGDSWKARLGKSGLVWGKGLSPVPNGAVTKKEGDNRSPAGVFSIGGAWGYDSTVRKSPSQFYQKVTSRDLWVEDSASPQYNQHILLDHEPATAWEKKQQMKQDDDAHALKLFIAHNAPPNAVPNAGSSIFFHIWRGGGTKPTAGCTTMEKPKLQWVISRIDPARHPLYVLLPVADYQKYKAAWKLP